MTRAELIEVIGETVLGHLDRAATNGKGIVPDEDPLLDRVAGAFEHTSIDELVFSMVDGIRHERSAAGVGR